jgi:hypothetical protein
MLSLSPFVPSIFLSWFGNNLKSPLVGGTESPKETAVFSTRSQFSGLTAWNEIDRQSDRLQRFKGLVWKERGQIWTARGWNREENKSNQINCGGFGFDHPTIRGLRPGTERENVFDHHYHD